MNTAPVVRSPRASADHAREEEEILWHDGDLVLARARLPDATGRPALLLRTSTPEACRPALDRIAHEHGLREHLGEAWAVRPLDLVRRAAGTMLVLEDPGGQPLEQLLGRPLEIRRFLRLAIALAEAVARMHARGLVHKDLKPAHVLVAADDSVRLTGFGIASRLPRERLAPAAPEVIAGTLAYMAPEQTGRMNRSIDARSDLYSLGVTYYRMLTGVLPFTASDPAGWVHSHIARRAVPPAERADVPGVVSAMVMKLLAKTAEDRYQTAAGAAADLRRCMDAVEASGSIGDFTPGADDVPDVVRLPEKLYGREREVATLLAAFDRVAAQGAAELVLVSGYAGVGKSSVVNELHKVMAPGALFASGKFEQYRRDVPYATLAQALGTLVRQVLARSEAELVPWREALHEALGAHAELVTRIIPELALLVGHPAPAPELPAREAQARFRRVFRRLVGVFARPGHPLVLFLDDLQWLDAGSLALLADLATDADVRHLLLVGAYRDNEVDASHPLSRSVDAIRSAGGAVSEIVLAPLAPGDVRALVADALHSSNGRSQPLADLVHEKTGGNPFFAIQFLGALAEEGLLAFDAGAGGWVADLERIHAMGYTDNVVDLMVDKLDRLGADTRDGMKELACLGSHANLSTLVQVCDRPAEAVHACLWPAVRDGLLLRMPGSYAFVHDRVQEAAYSLIPPDRRPEVHLDIGRRLLAGAHAADPIDIVDQLNRGAALLADAGERVQVAALNLRAGRQAKASTAYASACGYFAAGMGLLDAGAWERHHALAFGLWLDRAECEYLCGNAPAVEPLTDALLAHAASRIEKACAYRVRIDLHMMRSEYPEAVGAALDCLRLFGIDMPPHPTREQVDAEYERVWRNLGERPVEALLDLPRMTDPDMQAAMGVLALLNSPAYFTDAALVRLHLCHMVNLTLAHGIGDASPHALALLGRRYAWFDLPAGWRVARYADAQRFGEVAWELVEKLGLAASRPKVRFSMALAAAWTQPITIAVDHVRSTHQAAVEGGDLTIACYSLHHALAYLLLRGDPLEDVSREAERALLFVRKARFGDVANVILAQDRFVQALRGRTAHVGTFADAGFDEAAFEAGLGQVGMALMVCVYWILKQQARFLAGDHAAARDAGRRAESLLGAVAGHVQLLEYHLYAALLVCATWHTLPSQAQREARGRLGAHMRQLAEWAGNGAVAAGVRLALVQAEAARIEDRELQAERLYEDAIRLAREHHFVQNEALAWELAGRFHAGRGMHEVGELYLRKARQAWLRWGAAGKARRLEDDWPELREQEHEPEALRTIGAPVEHLDLATVIRVSQAVSGEIVLEKMLDTLMRTAIEHAGADRGLLVLADAGGPRLVAEATTTGDAVVVQVNARTADAQALPQSILQYVLRTQESVILADAAAQGPFAADPYVAERRSRSVMCLPLLNRGRPIGVLYLENSLATSVFVPARIAVLKLLASEAAISLENTRLYRELAEREARIRRLVDANIIGIFMWDFRGRILDANDSFLRMIGYERGELVAGGIRWKDLTPPEWQERDLRELVPEIRHAGTLQPYEKEYIRKDGSRVPVLIGAATFDGGDEGVAFVLDLSERKRSEAEARDSDRRYHEMRMRLAEANRHTSLGQLSASIAHEVNQPLSGIITNAATCLRMLDAASPNLDGARETARRTIRDARRAADVVARLRELFGRKPSRLQALDLNAAAREVVALSLAELQSHGAVLALELAGDVPWVTGDRVQLQQVVLNLLRNACEAMAEVEDRPRTLVVRTGREGADRVRLSVRDAGVGLAPDVRDRLFEPFHTTKGGGMGIGLSVSRSIIASHDGRLWAEDNADAPGVTFAFSLPVAPHP